MLFDENITINLPEPRAWQKKALPQIVDAIHKNQKSVLCIPTGCGKTVFATMLFAEIAHEGKRALFVVDRLVLINQTKDTFERCGVRCDILQGFNSTYTNAPVVVASQQTLVRRELPNVDIIIVDECHSISKKMEEIINDVSIPVLGLSATPFRKGLGKLFNTLYNPYTTHEATQDGVLVPIRVKECKLIDMDGSSKIGGEFSDREVERRASEIIGDVVGEYKRYANNKAIAFCATIDQCTALAQEFIMNGIPSAVFCADTTPEDREIILDKYNNTNEIMVLCSVAALSTGFDSPQVRTVLDCRPLSKSLSTYIQSIGRALRSAPDKDSALLLDFTGNMRHFKDDFVDFYLNGLDSLHNGEKKDAVRKEKTRKEKKGKGCPECSGQLWAKLHGKMTCLGCGFIMEVKEQFEAVKDNYEVKDLDIFAARKGYTNKELWQTICTWTSLNRPNNKEKAAVAIYKQISGNFPKWGEAFKTTTKPNKTVLDKILANNIAYQKKGNADATRIN